MKLTSVILFVSVCLVGVAAAQSVPSSSPLSVNLYDDFNHQFLAQGEWNTQCFAGNISLECAIEIQSGQLRMANRATGQRTSDTGFQVGVANANFSAHSEFIKSITTDVTVEDIQESPCAANPSFGGNAGITARFFNPGTGNRDDDVGAQVVFGRAVTSPKGELNVFGQFFQNGIYTTFVLGKVSIGTPVTETLTWDKPNHQFIATWTNNVTHITTTQAMPYFFPDNFPAVDPTKSLQVDELPSNCTATQTSVYVQAMFDNVFVGR